GFSCLKVAWWLYVGRLLLGCGMGILSYVVPVYIAEITTKDLRGGFTAIHQLMICFGVSLTYLIGAYLNWRVLALIGTIPCLAQLLSLSFIPESPRWLAKVGCWERSKSALQHLRGKNADVSEEATEIRDFIEAFQQQTEDSIMGLFQLQYLKSLTVGVGLIILQQFGGINGITFYASSIFVSAGFSKSIGTVALVIVQIPMSALGVILMDKSGRIPLLLISASGTCLGCVLASLSFFLQDSHKWMEFSPILALVGVFIGSFSLGMGGIPWVIMSEIAMDSKRKFSTRLLSSIREEARSVPTRVLILTTLVAVSGSYVFGSAVGYSSPAQSGIMDDLNLDVAEYSLFGSILTIGAMVGAIVSGSLADYAGRRVAMGFSELCCILGWLAIVFSKVAWWLYVGRLLLGCGMGILSYVVPVYIAEITTKDLRGGFTAIHQVKQEHYYYML
ncbi:sugar transporter ERD6-like 5-like protein, partial [Trifolium pratense]